MIFVVAALILLVVGAFIPLVFTFALVTFSLVSAVAVQICAGIVSKSEVAFAQSMKAVLLSGFLSVVALLCAGKIVSSPEGIAQIVPFVFMLVAQSIAYSIALEFTFLASLVVALLTTVVGWVLIAVFGLSLSFGLVATN